MAAAGQGERIGKACDAVVQGMIEGMPRGVKSAEGIFSAAQFDKSLFVAAFLIQRGSVVKEPLRSLSLLFR